MTVKTPLRPFFLGDSFGERFDAIFWGRSLGTKFGDEGLGTKADALRPKNVVPKSRPRFSEMGTKFADEVWGRSLGTKV